jgi:hypothetical protein
MLTDDRIEIGPKIAAAAAVAILAHGRGRTPEEMRDVTLRLERPDIRFILPRAATGSWYPKGFMAPAAENEPFLSQSLGGYEALIDDVLKRGVAPEAARSLWGRPALHRRSHRRTRRRMGAGSQA